MLAKSSAEPPVLPGFQAASWCARSSARVAFLGFPCWTACCYMACCYPERVWLVASCDR